MAFWYHRDIVPLCMNLMHTSSQSFAIVMMLFLALSIPNTAAAGGDSFGIHIPSSMKQTPFVFSSAQDIPLGGIETNLPAGHPCTAGGGVWRGWCMNMNAIALGNAGGTGASRSASKDQVAPRRSSVVHRLEFTCRAIRPFAERRSCYRMERSRIFGVR
jgi:hypothetical protein